MNFYLAGPYSRRDDLRGYADSLQRLGHKSTASWLNQTGTQEDNFKNHDPQYYAHGDIDDIEKSDIVIVFANKADEPKSTGKNVELGYALAWASLGNIYDIYLIGEPENVFQHLCESFPTWEQWVQEALPRYA